MTDQETINQNIEAANSSMEGAAEAQENPSPAGEASIESPASNSSNAASSTETSPTQGAEMNSENPTQSPTDTVADASASQETQAVAVSTAESSDEPKRPDGLRAVVIEALHELGKAVHFTEAEIELLWRKIAAAV